MNTALTIHEQRDEVELIAVLQNSLYPGAKRESIELVLAYCRANGIDPMLKPVHIVATSIKLPNGNYETRDVLMPGIADYRIKASRSGEYGGKSEPEFGPDVTTALGGIEVTYPSWCRVTVRRIVQGKARDFPAVERWLENYATAKRDTQAPNTMWKKRPYGQLAKVAEAQALRMAFPEFSAGYTAEEMQGKTLDSFNGETIEADPPAPLKAAAAPMPRGATVRAPVEPATNGKRTDEQWQTWIGKLRDAAAVLYHRNEVVEIAERPSVSDALATGPEWVRRDIAAILAENYKRFPDEDQDELPEVAIAGEERMAAG